MREVSRTGGGHRDATSREPERNLNGAGELEPVELSNVTQLRGALVRSHSAPFVMGRKGKA